PRTDVSLPRAEPGVLVASGDPAHSEALSRSQRERRDIAVGVMLGILSAVCCTGTKILLRGVTPNGDHDWAVWGTSMKSLPSALSAWVLVAALAARRLPSLPSGQTIVVLLTVGLFVQGGGNLLFQWSLAMCGLALAVPTVFATLMLTGAVLG